jgi:hypothetical protein
MGSTRKAWTRKGGGGGAQGVVAMHAMLAGHERVGA